MDDDVYMKGFKYQIEVAHRAIYGFIDNPKVRMYVEGFQLATKPTYFQYLRNNNIVIGQEDVSRIGHIVSALGFAASRNDLIGVLDYSEKLCSSLPGDPTTPIKPPIIK